MTNVLSAWLLVACIGEEGVRGVGVKAIKQATE